LERTRDLLIGVYFLLAPTPHLWFQFVEAEGGVEREKDDHRRDDVGGDGGKDVAAFTLRRLHCSTTALAGASASWVLHYIAYPFIALCSVNDWNRFIRRLFTKRKLTQTSHIVQYCWILPVGVLLYGPKIRGSTLVSPE
jgi:hypothetical protein